MWKKLTNAGRFALLLQCRAEAIPKIDENRRFRPDPRARKKARNPSKIDGNENTKSAFAVCEHNNVWGSQVWVLRVGVKKGMKSGL